MQIWLGVLVGVVSGVVSSTVFYILLRGLQPKIEISQYIARVERDDCVYYDFKIINGSKRPLTDVRAHASLARQIYAQGGPVFQTDLIPLIRDHYFELGARNKDDQRADYALRFATTSDLQGCWSSDTDHIKLRIIATDSVSGFSKAFVQEFLTKRNCIVEGLHEFGESLDVS